MPTLSDPFEAEAAHTAVSMPLAVPSLAAESEVADATVCVPLAVPFLTATLPAVSDEHLAQRRPPNRNTSSANNAGMRPRRASTERRFAIGDTIIADGAVISDGSTDNTTFTGQVRCTC
jgi:hypothetical protein